MMQSPSRLIPKHPNRLNSPIIDSPDTRQNEDPTNGMLRMFMLELTQIECDIFISSQPMRRRENPNEFVDNLTRRERLRVRYDFYKKIMSSCFKQLGT